MAKCMKEACIFMNRILAAIRAILPTDRYPFDPDILSDLEWFLKFAESRDSIVLLPKELPQVGDIECDAILEAASAFSPSHYYAQPFPTTVCMLSSSLY